MRLLLPSILALAVAPAVGAQEVPDAAPKEPRAQEETDARALFAAAILRYKNATEQVARARIEPKADGAGGAFGIVIGGGGITGEPFQGEVEVWRGEDGATVVVSKEELPGFGVYVGEDRTIRQTTFEEEPPSLAELEAELVPLLDPARLSKHLMNAKLAVRRDAASGDWVFEGPVSRNVVRATRGETPFLPKRVIRTEAQVVLSAEGALRQVAVKVVHNDPMQEMARGRGIQVFVGPGGKPVAKAEEDKEEEEEHDVEGGSVSYRLDFGDSAPSERARAFKREVLRMLAADGK